MSTTSLDDTKRLELICPRCKEQKEDLDCLYRVALEVYSVKGSSNAKWASKTNTLEDFEYRLCGLCLDRIEEFIRNKAKAKAETKGTGPSSNEAQKPRSLPKNHASQQTTHRSRKVLKIGESKSTSAADY